MAPEGLCGPATNVPPPELLAETQRIAELCDFSLDILRYEYPHELTPPGKTATAYRGNLHWKVSCGAIRKARPRSGRIKAVRLTGARCETRRAT